LKFHRVSLTALFLLLLTTEMSLHAAQNVTCTTLPNGLKVIVRESHETNLAAIEIWVRAGSVHETEANNGISHLIEHMTFKATPKHGPGELDRELEGLGAEVNGGTSKDWVHFYTTVASESLPKALDLLGDAISNVQFRPEDIDKERMVVMDEIAREQGDPAKMAFIDFAKTAFPTSPYRLSATGTHDVVAKLTHDDLLAYRNLYYTPDNICVVIVGDVSTDSATEMVRKAFAGLSGRQADGMTGGQDDGMTGRQDDVKNPEATAASLSKRATFSGSGSQAYVVFGYPAPPVSEFKDACALDVILAILGETNRGRLASAFMSSGIPFTKIATDFMVQRYPSTVSALVAVNPRDADRAGTILQAEFHRLAGQPVTEGELFQAKRLVEGSDLFDQETFSGQARTMGLYASIGSYDMALNYSNTVDSLTASDIQDTARKYFGENSIETVVAPDSH